MKDNGIIWVLLATLSLMTAFGFVRTAEFQKRLNAEQAVLHRQAKDAVITTRAACNYRAFLTNQVVQTRKYIAKHPDGIPSLGFSRTYLEAQLGRQEGSVRSLKNLVCDQKALAPPPPRTTPATTTSG